MSNNFEVCPCCGQQIEVIGGVNGFVYRLHYRGDSERCRQSGQPVPPTAKRVTAR